MTHSVVAMMIRTRHTARHQAVAKRTVNTQTMLKTLKLPTLPLTERSAHVTCK